MPCTNCKFPGDECPASKILIFYLKVQGECRHYFHLHCIYKWIKEGKDKCPNCRLPWAVTLN